MHRIPIHPERGEGDEGPKGRSFACKGEAGLGVSAFSATAVDLTGTLAAPGRLRHPIGLAGTPPGGGMPIYTPTHQFSESAQTENYCRRTRFVNPSPSSRRSPSRVERLAPLALANSLKGGNTISGRVVVHQTKAICILVHDHANSQYLIRSLPRSVTVFPRM